jgi:hypothetical protein
VELWVPWLLALFVSLTWVRGVIACLREMIACRTEARLAALRVRRASVQVAREEYEFAFWLLETMRKIEGTVREKPSRGSSVNRREA